MSLHPAWFPLEAHTSTGRLRSAGFGACRSPTSSLLCSPPTSLFPSASALVFPRLWPTRTSDAFLRRTPRGRARPAVHPQTAGRVRDCGQALYTPETRGKNKDLPGFQVIFFERAAVKHPAGRACTSPCRCRRCCLRAMEHPGPPESSDFGATPRPTRSRTYASTRSLPIALQGSLPACLAGLWPDGFRTR